MASKPLQRSLKLMREEGYVCAITEKYNSFIRIRQDLYGFADFIAVNPDVPGKRGRVLVQTTSGTNLSTHRRKYTEKPKKKKGQKTKAKDMRKIVKILKTHFRLELHGWRKLKGSRSWQCKREAL